MTVTAQLHDGRILEFPDGTAPEVVQSTVKKVLAGPMDKPNEEAPSLVDRAKDAAIGFVKNRIGDAEAATSLATGATGGALGFIGGALGGLAGDVASGKYGTQEGARMAGETAAEGAHKLTYEPRTPEGKEALAKISRFFSDTKLEGIGPMALPQAQVAASEAKQIGQAAQAVRQGARDLAAKLPSREPQMVGMGAANTADAALRRQRAEALPVPLKLTKGQAERTFEQQQFEREVAKNPILGAPLRERYAEQNQKILQNFDAWVDQTGAEAGSLRATGEAVTQAVVEKSNKAKTQIRTAYDSARKAGDMQERIDVAPLQGYLDQHQAEAINAPVLTSVEAKLARVASDGSASINDLEEVRKMVGRLSGKDAVNALFGREVKGVIDQMTEGRGGELYKRARALRQRYAQEFEDHGVVDKLLSMKPGTKDRSVAYEDVFAHSILNGSLDDVRTVRRTLQTAGPKGQQAWRELQGATLRHVRDEITNNVQIDQAGRSVVSPAKLNRLVTELDRDGKLDFLFGKQGAQQIRDINGIAQDAFTAPPGAVNHSNTASVLLMMIDKVAAKTTGIPFLGAVTGFMAKEAKNAGIRKKVQESLK